MADQLQGNIFRILESHRSVRKYKSDPIPDELLDNILTATRQAPASSNLQAYSIIIVKESEKKRRLAHLCGDQAWVESCPVFLVMCPDLHRINRICEIRGYKFSDRYFEISLVAIVDTALVAQNIVVAAEASGLGICMIGGIRNNPDQVCELLNLPERVFPLMGICLGYPDIEPMIKPRLLTEAVIHREEYNDSNLEALMRDYDAIIKATGLYDGAGRKLPSPDGRTVAEDDYGWTEHSARRVASVDPKSLRVHMRKFLESRQIGLE